MPCLSNVIGYKQPSPRVPGAWESFLPRSDSSTSSSWQQQEASLSQYLQDEVYDGCSFQVLEPPTRPRKSSKRASFTALPLHRRVSIVTSNGSSSEAWLSSYHASTSTSMTESDSEEEEEEDDKEDQATVYEDDEDASIYSVVHAGLWQEYSGRSSFSCAGAADIQPISSLKTVMDGDVQAAHALEEMRQQRKALQESLEQYSITAVIPPSFRRSESFDDLLIAPDVIHVTPTIEKEVDPLEVQLQETFSSLFEASHFFEAMAETVDPTTGSLLPFEDPPLGLASPPRGELTPEKLPYLDARLRVLLALQTSIDR